MTDYERFLQRQLTEAQLKIRQREATIDRLTGGVPLSKLAEDLSEVVAHQREELALTRLDLAAARHTIADLTTQLERATL